MNRRSTFVSRSRFRAALRVPIVRMALLFLVVETVTVIAILGSRLIALWVAS